MREGLLQEDKILELGKGKASEKVKMLNEKRTKALKKELRKKLLENTLEKQQEFMAEKLLKKDNLNIEEEANINKILENNKKMYMFNKEEEYRKTANKGGMLDQDRYGMKDGGPGIEALRKEAPEVVERMGYEEGGEIDDQMLMVMTPPMESEMESEMPMESDDNMEDGYTRFIMEEALSEEEEDMLTSKLEQDEELSMLFDKIIDVAQEFAGSGPVEGPGSGVSDSIPARLSDGEFVFTAKAVEEIGADNLMAMMKDAEMKADDRQGLAEGGEPEEDTVEMEVEKPATKQDIRVVKTTVDNGGKGLLDEDEISKSIKSKMMLDNRTGRHVQS